MFTRRLPAKLNMSPNIRTVGNIYKEKNKIKSAMAKANLGQYRGCFTILAQTKFSKIASG